MFALDLSAVRIPDRANPPHRAHSPNSAGRQSIELDSIHKSYVLCFHIDANSFCRNRFVLIFMQTARGVYPPSSNSLLIRQFRIACVIICASPEPIRQRDRTPETL
jgi:hypothetical protein